MNKYFKFDKKDSFILIGTITAIVGTFTNPLLFGFLTLLSGIISKFAKAKYWLVYVLAGIGIMSLHFF